MGTRTGFIYMITILKYVGTLCKWYLLKNTIILLARRAFITYVFLFKYAVMSVHLVRL